MNDQPKQLALRAPEAARSLGMSVRALWSLAAPRRAARSRWCAWGMANGKRYCFPSRNSRSGSARTQ